MIETIDFLNLRAIGLQPSLINQALALPTEAGDQLMRVIEVQRDRLTLDDGLHRHAGQLWPSLRLALQAQDDALVVGDWVAVRGAGDGPCWVTARVPPLNRVLRRDSSGQRQALVSNVDTALLVMTCGHDFNLRRLDRYLALVRLSGVAPVVVLTQADLHRDPEARVAAVQAHLGGAAVPVLALNACSAEPLARLGPWLSAGQTLVLLGSSGAGKSTLTNALTGAAGCAADPTAAFSGQLTGAAREDDGRGRHTTTARSMHRCRLGACIIDTPGLRGLQLDADERQLAQAFDDVSGLAGHCRFRNCQHEDEPGCAVRGAVSAERLLSYRKLLREAQRHEMTVLDRRVQLAEWKARSRHAKEVAKVRRG